MSYREIRLIKTTLADAEKLEKVTLPDGHYLSVSYDERPNEDSPGEMAFGHAVFPWLVQKLEVSKGTPRGFTAGSSTTDIIEENPKVEFVFLMDIEAPQFSELIRHLACKQIFVAEERGVMHLDEFLGNFMQTVHPT